ncbi:MAG: class I SAM-dependent methyltransferase [Lewinellaceae bacterium]|nr:class I SAM-dependent methyltransferase [Lewinellaceae bacterium]
MQKHGYSIRQFLAFFRAADTKFRVHSPFVFELANAVLEDQRWFYAFSDVEAIRRKMQQSMLVIGMVDYGASAPGGEAARRRLPIRQIARRAASSSRQGQWLFRLVQWQKPQRILELGTSLGIGAMYLAAAARTATIFSLEGSPDCAHVAKANLELLGLNKQVTVKTGPFQENLPASLQALQTVDLVFFDGHHRADATLQYFEQCLPHVYAQTILVFDDVYWSPEMTAAWKKIQQHPQVTLTVDFFDLSLVFFNPDFKSRQHFKLLPSRCKPWYF